MRVTKAGSVFDVALITSKPQLTRIVRRSVVSMGCSVFPLLAEKEPLTAELGQSRDMYIVDTGADEQIVTWFLDELGKRQPAATVLMLSRGIEESRFIYEQICERGINHIVARHGGIAASQEIVDETELMTTCHKLLSRDIFGLDKYIVTPGVHVKSELITSSSQGRIKATENLDQYLEDVGCYEQLIPLISTVADEMIMNAIFNAPHDENGKPKYASLSRSNQFDLAGPREHVEFKYACDGRYMALSVQDLFGTLEREVILRYLTPSFLGKQAVPEDKQHGAGLGLHKVFQAITQLVFNIESGVRTEVIALFYIRRGARKMRASGHSLNLFFA